LSLLALFTVFISLCRCVFGYYSAFVICKEIWNNWNRLAEWNWNAVKTCLELL